MPASIPRRRVVLGAVFLLLLPLLATAPVPPAWAEDVVVPDVRRLRLGDARTRLAQAGLRVGEVWEVSWERIVQLRGVRFPVGYVYVQAPGAGTTWPADKPVYLAVSALRETRVLPAGLLQVLTSGRSGSAPPAESGEEPGTPAREEPQPEEPQPAAPQPEAPQPPAPPPVPPGASPETAQPAAPPPAPAPGEGGGEESPPVATGSPDAPRPAPPADPRKVPSVLGLELSEAEQLVRDAEMTLYVERVPGHPIGRVLEQTPGPYAPRPAGGVVKIVVTAGGDFDGATPPSPEVYVPDVAVPDLLDRTALQAGRIIGDLGLVMQQEEARRGLPGLVVDQMPAAGSKLARGGVVRVWIGPPDPSAPKPPEPGPPTPPPAPRPRRAEPDSPPDQAPPAPEIPQPEPAPPLPPGPLPGGVPKPVSPGHGTELPKDEVVPVGFTWRGVKGAQVYIVEVEEEGAEGAWLPSVRKPSKKTAVLLDVERLGTGTSGRLRWRVRAVVGGREGTPSDWVLLK